MYAIYETEAFILESRPRREADKVFSLYTEDFGLIRATAVAARKMESKLRPHLSDFSLVSVSLVRGKDQWRLVAARRTGDLPDLQSPCGKAFVRASLLVTRLVRGERVDPKLFAVLRLAYGLLLEKTAVDPLAFEIGLVLKILHELGYVDPAPPFADFIASPEFSRQILSDFAPFARQAVALVNSSIRESQL